MKLVAEFKPTYLYIKRHLVTGKLYFGKTTECGRYTVLEYSGSGRYWSRHLKEHGNQVETIWYCLFTDKDELVKFALMCSEQWNIVKEKDVFGKKMWANEKPENGLDGWIKGNTYKEVFGEQRAAEIHQTKSISRKGKPNGHLGLIRSEDSKRRMRETQNSERVRILKRQKAKSVMTPDGFFANRFDAAAHYGVGAEAIRARIVRNSPGFYYIKD